MANSTEKTIEWEQLAEMPKQGPVVTERSKVPGGWLVRLVSDHPAQWGDSMPAQGYGLEMGGGICFYPDPNHEWI